MFIRVIRSFFLLILLPETLIIYLKLVFRQQWLPLHIGKFMRYSYNIINGSQEPNLFIFLFIYFFNC